MRFFNYLKTAVKVLTVVLQVVIAAVQAIEAVRHHNV